MVIVPSAVRSPTPWNEERLVGQKRALRPRDVWSIRVQPEIAEATRALALFNLAIDSELRACDLVRLRVDDVWIGGRARERATTVQKKTGRTVHSRYQQSRRHKWQWDSCCNTWSWRRTTVSQFESEWQAAETRVTAVLPAELASAEAQLNQAQEDNRPCRNIVNHPSMRPAVILIPEGPGRLQLQARVGQIETQGMKVEDGGRGHLRLEAADDYSIDRLLPNRPQASRQ